MIQKYSECLSEVTVKAGLTPEQIEWCDNYIIGEWRLNSQGEVEVKADLAVKSGEFTRFPVKFANVSRGFYCYNCAYLTSLEGAPQMVEGSFYCYNCMSLTTLLGAPRMVKGRLDCWSCPMIPQEEIDFLKNSPDLFFDWLKTGLTFREYQEKYKGKIKGNKFGL